MPAEDTSRRTKRRKHETSLRDAIMKCIKQCFELHGLEDTIQKFYDLKKDFGANYDWADIEDDVMFFIKEKKMLAEEAEKERQRQMDQAMVQGLMKTPSERNPLTQFVFTQPVGIVAPSSTITTTTPTR